MDVLDRQPGRVTLKVEGPGASVAFRNESGGHRWQRVPPTEKRGRVHTSTITVAVMPLPDQGVIHLDEKDITWRACRGSGAGGQHRNVTSSAIQMTHRPTGIQVRIETERSQHQNRLLAYQVLQSRLLARANEMSATKENRMRRKQVGSGMRGDKRRTVRLQADQVVDHVTGKRMPAWKYLRGEVDALA